MHDISCPFCMNLQNVKYLGFNQGFRQDLGNWVCKKPNWVCKILTHYTRNSFVFFFASFAAPKTFFLAHLFNIGLLFLAQLLKKNLKKFRKT